MSEDIKKYIAKFPDKYIVVDGTIINLSELKAIKCKDYEYYNERYIERKGEKSESKYRTS